MKKPITLFYSFILFVLNSTHAFAAPVYYNAPPVSSGVSVCNLVGVSDLKSLLETTVTCLFQPLVVVIMSLSIFIFIYKIFIYSTTDGFEKKEEARNFIFLGIIAIFVMISLWGLVNVLQRTFTFTDRVTPRNVNISY